ncbi:hypothetical protein HZF05_14545 [Sphingomonas sp. CGMCC 1.13654]|uniref:Uncharacterized protein n=1 Tax=Sphingomonas chungangi TaxID=2683589 RepID=A0A838L802_9SPHN|nr:hypothetical protein [Sphingomonas chungangi]MBA2935304.1 hypothetical protein [Sphingomonas chungangi]MVW56811.1 hypothetical protein [Sphingomonas chungangi]
MDRLLRAALAVMAVAGFSEAAWAVDIGKALQRPVSLTLNSSKGIFDLERCIVLLDGPGGPSVFRQPDRPDDDMIAYIGNGMAVTNVITLHRSGGSTTIEIRENRGLASGVLRKTPMGIESCL